MQAFSKASRSCAHPRGTTSPCAVPLALGGVPDASTHEAYASLAAWQRLRAERRTEASVGFEVSEAEKDAEEEENMHWEKERRRRLETCLDGERERFFSSVLIEKLFRSPLPNFFLFPSPLLLLLLLLLLLSLSCPLCRPLAAPARSADLCRPSRRSPEPRLSLGLSLSLLCLLAGRPLLLR